MLLPQRLWGGETSTAVRACWDTMRVTLFERFQTWLISAPGRAAPYQEVYCEVVRILGWRRLADTTM